MKNHSTRIAPVAVATAAAMMAAAAWADDLASIGRDILAKHQDAVVSVKLAIKQAVSMGGRENKSESKTSTTGTVIDPSGLTVVSLAATDPSSTIKDAYARAIAARGGDLSQFKFDSELNDVKIVLADGTEIPAEVVLRDKDLDLAYLRPSDKPAKPLACLDLTNDARTHVLDEVIVLNRLSQAANRASAISIGRIEGVLDKPRTFYLLGQSMWAYSLGAPVFSTDGKLVGLVLLRNSKTQSDQDSGFLFSNLNQWGMMPVILPASDIIDGAKQAMEAKAPTTEQENKPGAGEKPGPAAPPAKSP